MYLCTHTVYIFHSFCIWWRTGNPPCLSFLPSAACNYTSVVSLCALCWTMSFCVYSFGQSRNTHTNSLWKDPKLGTSRVLWLSTCIYFSITLMNMILFLSSLCMYLFYYLTKEIWKQELLTRFSRNEQLVCCCRSQHINKCSSSVSSLLPACLPSSPDQTRIANLHEERKK